MSNEDVKKFRVVPLTTDEPAGSMEPIALYGSDKAPLVPDGFGLIKKQAPLAKFPLRGTSQDVYYNKSELDAAAAIGRITALPELTLRQEAGEYSGVGAMCSVDLDHSWNAADVVWPSASVTVENRVTNLVFYNAKHHDDDDPDNWNVQTQPVNYGHQTFPQEFFNYGPLIPYVGTDWAFYIGLYASFYEESIGHYTQVDSIPNAPDINFIGSVKLTLANLGV